MKLIHDEHGTALVVSLMATMLLAALGATLLMTTSTETMISTNYKSGTQSFYAVDAALERSIQDLLLSNNWNGIVAGTITSTFVDNPANAAAPDGTPFDFAKLTAAVQTDSDAIYGAAANRPIWRLYAHAPLSQLAPSVTLRDYVVVWVSDDPSETDNDPTKDGNGLVLLHAESFGDNGTHKVVEATVTGSFVLSSENGYMAQRGGGEQNRDTRQGEVGQSGQALGQSKMNMTTGGLVVQ